MRKIRNPAGNRDWIGQQKYQEPLSVRVNIRLTPTMWEQLTVARGEVEVGDYIRSLLEKSLPSCPDQE